MRQRVEFVDLTVDDELFLRLGAGYRLAQVGGPGLELDLALSVATSASKPFGAANRNYQELLFGAAYSFPAPVVGFVSVGAGLNAGYGTPDWRFLLGVRYVREKRNTNDKPPVRLVSHDGWQAEHRGPDMDHDGDGVVGRRDRCPDQAEVVNGIEDDDGCPDELPDTDGDGVLGAADGCPNQAEDLDGFQDLDGCPDLDNDQDHVVDALDQCPMTVGNVASHGCPYPDRDQDGVPDRLDNCPDQPGKIGFQGCLVRQFVVLTVSGFELLDAVHFHPDQASFESRSYRLLDNIVTLLIAHPSIRKVRVAGHTDNLGDVEHNHDLSQHRAQAVMDYLVAHGIAPERLEAKGYGARQPIADNRTEAGQSINRRVDFEIIERE